MLENILYMFDFIFIYKLKVLFFERFQRCGYCGFYFIAFVALIDFLLIQIFEFFNPSEKIDIAPDASGFGRQKKQLRHSKP